MPFADRATEDIYNNKDTKAARKRLPADLWEYAQEQIQSILTVEDPLQLRKPPSNNFEALKGARKGQFSIRINLKYRVCFTWTDDGAADVEITDYH